MNNKEYIENDFERLQKSINEAKQECYNGKIDTGSYYAEVCGILEVCCVLYFGKKFDTNLDAKEFDFNKNIN